jgi:2-polyprenyl-3-methyl-5-hydroxy-6-metoxy-1,4-benzoquinol methylase
LKRELDSSQIQRPDFIGDLGEHTVKEISDKEFDFIICNHVIEHTPNPIEFLSNLFVGFKNDGVLVFSVPNNRFPFDKCALAPN